MPLATDETSSYPKPSAYVVLCSCLGQKGDLNPYCPPPVATFTSASTRLQQGAPPERAVVPSSEAQTTPTWVLPDSLV
jgi:hypothetical protein